MAEDQRHIISHPDGRTFSVTEAAFKEVYKPQGFAIDHPEGDADFVATGIPKPKRVRTRPRAKDAAPIVEPATETSEG